MLARHASITTPQRYMNASQVAGQRSGRRERLNTPITSLPLTPRAAAVARTAAAQVAEEPT
jgi:hypothetical protein